MSNYFAHQFLENSKKLIDYWFLINYRFLVITDRFENIMNEFPDVDYICVHSDYESKRNVENVSKIIYLASGYYLTYWLTDIPMPVCPSLSASGHI